MMPQIFDNLGQPFEADTRYLGGAGPIPITGTSPVAGPFFSIQAGGNGATISALAGLTGTWTDFTLAAGQSILAGVSGSITSVTLSAGSAIGYRL